MKFSIRPATEAETLYCYNQSTQIAGQTGNIGYLRADMDNDGNGFYSSWEDRRGYLKGDEFKDEFDKLVKSLRQGKKTNPEQEGFGILANKKALAQYCEEHPKAKISVDNSSYGFRADTDQYSYMLRLSPDKDEYNVYCYCYRRDWFDEHLRNAEKGIRFITPHYEEIFRIPDGGKIKISRPGFEDYIRTARFIDPYHVEIHIPMHNGVPDFRGGNLYHICEFAEIMERNSNKVEPVTDTVTERRSPERVLNGEAR